MIAMHEAIMGAPGAYGARGAGAGFGGCLVAIINNDSIKSFTQYVHDNYLGKTNIEPEIYPVRAAQGAGVLLFKN